MRVVRRKAERLVDTRLELLRDRMLQPVGLVVHVRDVDAERLGEVELEQPVVPDHFDGDALSEELEARIDKVLGYPTHDPHGDPIPDADLNWPSQP